MNCYWIRNTEYDLKDLRRASKGVAVLPLGSIESHGPHLPLGSDTLTIAHMLERVIAKETVAVLPVLPYSYVGEARMLPGAIHVPSHILMDQVEAICDEVHRNGFDKIVLLHGHGGNVPLHSMFVKRMQERCKPYAVYSLPPLCNMKVDIAEIIESSEWGHACEMETSANLVFAPELVNLKRLGKKRFPAQPGPDVGGALTSVDWTARHPEMAVGDPQKATAEKGEKIISEWAKGVIDALRKIKRDRIAPVTIRRFNRRVANPQSIAERKPNKKR